jgi:DNA-binding XRE family transcriptional regulator
MAQLVGISRRRYSEVETKGSNKIAFIMVVEPLQFHEKCLILRRRFGATQQECARILGVSRYWYNLMENGTVSSDRLEELWK